MIIFRCIVFGAAFGVLHGLLGVDTGWAVVGGLVAIAVMG